MLSLAILPPLEAVAQQAIEFDSRRDYLTDVSPDFVLAQDLDHDGDLDLVINEGFLSPRMKVYLNSGSGIFFCAAQTPFSRITGKITSADVDGDGWTDIIASSPGSPHQVLLFRGAEPPTFFASPTALEINSEPGSLTVSDIDEDGNADLVITSWEDHVVFIYLGDGTGAFSHHSDLTVIASPQDAAVGDINLDGRTDLVVSSITEARCVLLIGLGGGSFDPPLSIPLPDPAPRALLVDLDADGGLDLIVSETGVQQASVFYSDGAGAFEPSVQISIGGDTPRAVVASDLNADGTLDLLFNLDFDESSVVLSTGPTSYAAPVIIDPGNDPVGLATGDLDGDLDQDIVVTSGGGSAFSVFLNDGTGGLGPIVRSIPTPVGSLVNSDSGDWNGDGVPDVIVSEAGGADPELWLMAGVAGGDLLPVTLIASGTDAKDLVGADFNNDGALDLALAKADVVIYQGDGNGAFIEAYRLPLPAQARAIDTGDFDEDGHVDVVIGIFDVTQTWTLLSDGMGGFLSPLIKGGGYQSIRVADVDGDGHLDLGLTWAAAPTRVRFGDGTGDFTAEASVPTSASSPRSIALADFDGDSKVDVALIGDVPNSNRGRVSVARNVSGRTFQFVESHLLQTNAQVIDPIDADGDGVVDLACVTTAGSIRIIRGRGDGTFEDPAYAFGYGLFAGSRRIAIADYDGDRRPDMLLGTGNGSGGLGLLLNRSPAYPSAVSQCLQGDVNAGRGSLANVLFVNDSAGDPSTREFSIAPSDPFRVVMTQPPSRAATKPKSNFALFAWGRAAVAEKLVTLPLDSGCLAFPIPATGGTPIPQRTWNNLGYTNLIGSPDVPSTPAPSTVIDLPAGVGRSITFTLQGLIRDDGAAGSKGVSPTNGVIVRVE